MKDSAKYAKVVEWSEEDQCYVGSAPGLILGGCHGDDEKQVFEELSKKLLCSTARITSPFRPRPRAMTSPIVCRTSHNKPIQPTPKSGAADGRRWAHSRHRRLE